MATDTIGSIATHIAENFAGLPAGISGNLVEIVDLSRMYVQNFTGDSIGSNSIAEKYQSAITNFAKADVIDLNNAQPGADKITLADLSIDDSGGELSAEQYRKLAEMNLRVIGRKVRFARSLS